MARNLTGKYLKLLKVELEDLETDIHFLEKIQDEKKENGDITKYVYLENRTVLLNEIAAIDALIRQVDSISIDQFASPDEFLDYIHDELVKKYQPGNMPAFMSTLLERKFKKIQNYLADEM